MPTLIYLSNDDSVPSLKSPDIYSSAPSTLTAPHLQLSAYSFAFPDRSARPYSVVHRSMVSLKAYHKISEAALWSGLNTLTASLYLALIS